MGIKQILIVAVAGFCVLTALNNSPDSAETPQSNLKAESNKSVETAASTENQPLPIEKPQNIETEQAQNIQQAGNVPHSYDKVVVDIIKFIEQLEAENQWLSRIGVPSDEEQAKYNATYADVEDTKMDITNHLMKVMDKFAGKSIPQNIYNLYSNGRYGNFSMSGNVLPRGGVTRDKWERGEYSYEVINGFWDGNTDYPVVSVNSDRDYHFNSNLNTRSNTIFVLDVNSIAYVDGAIYANVLTLNRWVESTSNGNKNSFVLMESGNPMLYRFVFSARDNGDSQNLLENVRVSVDKDYFTSDFSNLFYLKRGIRDWYEPSTSQRDFPQTLEWAFGKPGVIELDDSFYMCRDILIFSIYKLSVGA